MSDFRPARMVVFLHKVRRELDGDVTFPLEGPILYKEEPIASELGDYDNAGDLEFASAPPVSMRGLLIWEGWIEWSVGDDPDMTLEGEFRKLDHWEMCKVRDGRAPWELTPAELAHVEQARIGGVPTAPTS